MKRDFIAILAGPAILSLSGCIIDGPHTGPTRNESVSIERDKSELVRVELRMGAGELRVQGGAEKLMQADFTYNVPDWKPVVRYNSPGFRGQLSIEQPGSHFSHGNIHYKWDVRLNDETPLDLSVNFGAGEARLDLGSLTLRSIDVNMGVGELQLDLRGSPRQDYDVRIRGGVGEATVRLPRDVGVSADAKGGIGGITARGLEKRGDRYVNSAYDNAKVRIHLDIRGGIGNINLFGD